MSSGTWPSYHAITVLMYEYADCVDRGDYDGVGRLFAHGRITQRGGAQVTAGAEAVAALYRFTTKVHADGTTRARHLNANVIVDIDEDAGTATARSVFVVFQATDRVALQPIVSGRYRDRFERVDGTWRFAEREMDLEHVGDVRDHLSDAVVAMLDRPTT